MTEENYREEIALLQLRLVESALEESVLKTTDDRYASSSTCKTRYTYYNLEYKSFIIIAFVFFQVHVSRQR